MKKKIVVFSIILITLINTLMPVVKAATTITKANLINDHSIKTHIKQENENGWFEVICNYICYKEKNDKYPAYCIMPGTHGVDEEGSYVVTVNKLLNDKLIYNTLINGYPYRTPVQLGLETADEAYVATKLALKSVLLDRNVREQYKAIDKIGERIIEAMEIIAFKGKNGNEINKHANITINELGDFIEKENYYYKEYKVISDSNISEYIIDSFERFPKGTYITDENGITKKTFLFGENFRIVIPKSEFNKDISGKINITATCNTKPVFYGEAPSSTIQDYAITYKPFVEYQTSLVVTEETNTSSIKIQKQDNETSNPIIDVEFGLYNQKNECIMKGTTNDKGILIFNNLYQGTYKLRELKANKNYEVDETIYEIVTEYNKQITKTITNIHKKGNLKITKIDKDDKTKYLDGIEFDLINNNGEIIAHLVTDSNGEAAINNINIGEYTLKETKTNDNYNLCIDKNIEVKWNETTDVKIENEKKKGYIKIIKQDAENSNIKLEGVEFHIIDIDNKLVDKVITDKEGVGISSKLPIGEYIIKESSLGENNQYILNEEEYKIIVEDEKTKEVVIENTHKKGKLKIIKVDKDDKTLTLGAIEFDLINDKGDVIAHLITDVNGEVYVQDINTGAYTLKETKTKREYNLCENKDIIVEWNKTSEVIIENEKKKGQIKIIKEDDEIEDIKLKGVKFQIIDKNNKVIEEIISDDNGEALSSRLLIGEYKIKEIDIGNNSNYLLNDEIYSVHVKDQLIEELHIKNQHKKGSINIKKVDYDNSNIVLEGVKFKIIDKDGFIYEAVTNTEGVAKVDNIRIGNIKIKEIDTCKDYILDKEIHELDVMYNQCVEILLKNEKKKGQVEIYKTDGNDKKIKLSNVEFEILNSNKKIVDKLITDENGYAISKRLETGKYYLRETKTNDKYILNNDITKISIEYNKVLKLNIQNEKMKGKIKIIKTSSKDSPILNIKYGEIVQGVEFQIFNSKNELVDTLITDEKGQAISKNLEIGRYKVIEKNTNPNYILNSKEFFVNINSNDEIKTLEVENEPIIPSIDIEKEGQQFAEKNEEIKYEFDIKNMSNTKLDEFTFVEYIPYEYCRLRKMITGTYNKNLDYEIYYKTNINDYKFLTCANTLISQYINFEDIDLEKEEIITELKIEYKAVSKDFRTEIRPCIFTKINNNVKEDDEIINSTQLSGRIGENVITDISTFKTIIKNKKIIKKLPKTGC